MDNNDSADAASTGEETRSCICGYVETNVIEKQGHTHEFYNEAYLENHKGNGNYGYIIDEDGYRVSLYTEPYGKKDRTYHYAYCVVEGCGVTKKETVDKLGHKYSTSYTIDKKATASADGTDYSVNYASGRTKVGRYAEKTAGTDSNQERNGGKGKMDQHRRRIRISDFQIHIQDSQRKEDLRTMIQCKIL